MSKIGVKIAESEIVVANETTRIFLILALSPAASASATCLKSQREVPAA